eukprot:1154470-Pelagomonas_calceolata.AAC.5
MTCLCCKACKVPHVVQQRYRHSVNPAASTPIVFHRQHPGCTKRDRNGDGLPSMRAWSTFLIPHPWCQPNERNELVLPKIKDFVAETQLRAWGKQCGRVCRGCSLEEFVAIAAEEFVQSSWSVKVN